MTDLRHIVPPGKRPDRWLRAAVGIVGVFVFLAIAKPWGSGRPSPLPFPVATPGASAAAASRGLVRGAYDPALFGQEVPDAAWQLWPAGYVVDFGLAGPVMIDPPTAVARPSPVAPAPTPSAGSPFGASQPVRLGGADNIVALGINNPDDVLVTAIRLWRFDGRLTHRVPVSSLRTPWPTPHFHVIGMPSRDSSDGLGPWMPGVYRLDLLTAPSDTIRSIVIAIDPPNAGSAAAPSPAETPTATPGERQPRPDVSSGMLTLFEPGGSIVEEPALAVAEEDARCGLAALWLGETASTGSRCAPVHGAGLVAIGLDIGSPGVASVEIRALDPVPGDIAIDVAAQRTGGAVITRADRAPFADGFYELRASSADGLTVHWYIDVTGSK